MDWKPNRWLAVIATLFFWPMGMLYLGRWWLPVVYFVAFVSSGVIEFRAGTPMYSPFVILLAAPFHAFWVAHKATAMRRPWFSRWYGIVAVTVGFFAAVGLLRAALIEPFRLPSAAMEPTLPQRSFVVVSKLGYRNIGTYGITVSRSAPTAPPARGAIVVFDYPLDPSKHFIKRVLGIPGDTITSRNKMISVNGVPLAQASSDTLVTESLDDVKYQIMLNPERPSEDFEITVPAGHYFLVGDNRDGSDDSRRFGAVPAELLVGEVVYVLVRKRA
jgi:signal peptidase I